MLCETRELSNSWPRYYLARLESMGSADWPAIRLLFLHKPRQTCVEDDSNSWSVLNRC